MPPINTVATQLREINTGQKELIYGRQEKFGKGAIDGEQTKRS